MANCCGELLNCNELATIQYMKDLVSASRVSECVHVNSGQIPSDSCCPATGNDYIPRYGELSSTTSAIAPKRVVDSSNPANDKNGFTYITPTLVNSNCCAVSLQDEVLMKSQVAFECTVAESNTLTLATEPDYCDPNPSYSVTETRDYKRDRYVCNDGNIESSTTNVSTSRTHSGELERHVDGDSTSWTVSFDDVTVNGITSAQCNSVSSSTSVTLNGYSYGITVGSSPGQMPCDGGDIDVLTVDGEMHCDDDLSIEITNNFGADTIMWTRGDSDTVTINVPRNDSGQNSGTITITPTVWGETKGESTIDFVWDTCGMSPKATVNGCGALDVEFDWNDVEHVNVYDY